MKVGTLRVLKQRLEERYMNFGILPESIFFADADSNGFISIEANKIISMEKKLVLEVSKEKCLRDCTDRNNRGKELEKTGMMSEAVKLYEENIKPGCYPATHSFDRLLIYYRQNKEYKHELRVCKRAISVFPALSKYKNRLGKILSLLGNNKGA